MRKPMSIRKKLTSAFLSVLIISLMGVFIYIQSADVLLDYNVRQQERYYKTNRIIVACKENGEVVRNYMLSPSAEKEKYYREIREETMLMKDRLDESTDALEQAYLRAIGNLLNCYFEEVDEAIRLRSEGQRTYFVPYYRSATILSYLNEHLSLYTIFQLERDSIQFESLATRIKWIQNITWLSLLVAVIAVTVFISRFSRMITYPLERLVIASREMASGNLDIAPLPVKKMDEIGILTAAFNQMQQNTAGYVQKLKHASIVAEKLHEEEMNNARMKELLHEAQLSALRSQINPHFLFNTLNVISRAAVYDDPRKAEWLVVNLSVLLRYSIEHINTKVQLKNELDIMERYIQIQQYRFGDRVRYHKMIEPGLETARIPSMLLQPLIENAVSHGTEKKENGGSIYVRALHSGEKLILLVYDDGVGISAQKREEILQDSEKPEISRGQHIGLSNVIKRVRLQEQGKIDIIPNLRQGTLIRIETQLEFDEE